MHITIHGCEFLTVFKLIYELVNEWLGVYHMIFALLCRGTGIPFAQLLLPDKQREESLDHSTSQVTINQTQGIVILVQNEFT